MPIKTINYRMTAPKKNPDALRQYLHDHYPDHPLVVHPLHQPGKRRSGLIIPDFFTQGKKQDSGSSLSCKSLNRALIYIHMLCPDMIVLLPQKLPGIFRNLSRYPSYQGSPGTRL